MPFNVSRTVANCVTILLAGGRGSRLHELTSEECKPAVAFGGSARIVDFSLANAIASGTNRVMVATQYRPETLMRHLRATWIPRFAAVGGRLEIRDARAVTGDATGYAGTADALTRNIAAINAARPRDVLVLAADHVYAMDYARMVAAHRASGAALTVAVHVVPREEARGFGVVHADEAGRITDFIEKPKDPPAMPGAPDRALASMGIYVFDWRWLRARLLADAENPRSSHDFGHDILPSAVAEGVAQAFTFRARSGGPDYWRDVGTLDAFRSAQLDFAMARPPIDLRRELHAIEGCAEAVTPLSGYDAIRSVSVGPSIDRSLISKGCRIGHGAQVRESVLMPGSMVGEHARVSRAILAPGTLVPRSFVVGEDPREDGRWFRRTPAGTVLVTQPMLDRRREERALLYPVLAPSFAVLRSAS